MSQPKSPSVPLAPLRGVALIAVSGVAALYFGFLHFTPAECEQLVRQLGYGWVIALFCAAGAALHAVVRHRGGWREAARALVPTRRTAFFILIGGLWLVRMDAPGYKVLYDEPVLAATTHSLHTQRELATTASAFHVGGLFTIIRTYLDKRPPTYPVTVTLAHDLTGYRTWNGIAVNVAATFALLVCAAWLGRQISGAEAGGWAVVGWLATVPILGVNATSAGMDLLNLAILSGWLAVALLYARFPSRARCALFVIVTALLAYCRYESVLFVGAFGAVWLMASWHHRRWLIDLPLAALPLALLLYAWHNAVVANTPALWELGPQQTDRFSAAYLVGNLTHALRYFFVVSKQLPNSPVLAVVGVAGLAACVAAFVLRRSLIPAPERIALLAGALGVAGNLAILMFYYWGELDDPIVSRFSLPMHLILVLAVVGGWRELGGFVARLQGWRPQFVAIGATLLVLTVPAVATDYYTIANLVRRNYEWEHRVVEEYWPRPGLIVANRSTMCWLAEEIAAVSIDRARWREADLAWHLRHHSFGTVLVAQRVLTRGADGGWVVDQLEATPPYWRMEEVAVKRIGLTLTRISRLVAIDLPPGAENAPRLPPPTPTRT